MHTFAKVSTTVVSHKEVHKSRMEFGCHSLTNSVHLAVPE